MFNSVKLIAGILLCKTLASLLQCAMCDVQYEISYFTLFAMQCTVHKAVAKHTHIYVIDDV